MHDPKGSTVENEVARQGKAMVKQTGNEYFLDTTHLKCPMTFVRAKLFLANCPPGGMVKVRLNTGEALENMPAAVSSEGHEVISLVAESTSQQTYIMEVKVALESV